MPELDIEKAAACHVILLSLMPHAAAPPPPPPLPGMPSPTPEISVAGQKLSQGCKKHLTKKQHLHANTWDHPMCIAVPVHRHCVYACMCFVQLVKSTDSRSLQGKEGARTVVPFFFLVFKMHHQSLHAATKPDKTHMYM